MLNVAVDRIGGEQADPQTGDQSPCMSYIDLPADSPLRPSASAGLTVFDLRPSPAARGPALDEVAHSMFAEACSRAAGVFRPS